MSGAKQPGRWLVNKLTVAATIAALCTLAACKKTGEGTYEIEKPVVGTTTDTVKTPTVEVKKETTTVTVPKVKVKKPEQP
jgi:hypothetical protein